MSGELQTRLVLCRHFNNPIGCARDVRCLYAHMLVPASTGQGAPTSPKEALPAGKLLVSGQERDRSEFVETLGLQSGRGTLCKDGLAACKFGAKCRFLHLAASGIASAPAAAENDEGKMSCCVCYEVVKVAEHVQCSEGHFCCDDCFSDYAEVTWSERDFDDVEKPVVACPFDGCAHEFTDSQVMKHANETACERYMDKVQTAKTRVAMRSMQTLTRTLIETTLQTQDAASLETRAQRRARRTAERRLLEEQLRHDMPHALQCPRCGLGPLDYKGCDIVGYHQGQRVHGGGVIDNRCRCGFMAARKNEYVAWNGELPAEDSSDDDGAALASSLPQLPAPAVTDMHLALWRLTDIGFGEADAQRALDLASGNGSVAAALLYECDEQRISIHSPGAQRILAHTLARRT